MRSVIVRDTKGFTLIELLVVIAVISSVDGYSDARLCAVPTQ